MTPRCKEVVLRALRNDLGDDYARCKSAFQHYLPHEMQQLHGQSGRTRQQILDAYQAHEREVYQAMAEVQALP